MRRHWLGTLVGLCMLGLAAPTWAVPDTDTLFGEVTGIIDPAFALDLVVGTPATMTAEWDTEDFVPIEDFRPQFYLVRVGDNPNASLTFTVGSHTWVATDEIEYGEFFPFLLFDAEGDFLGARFNGVNSAGDNFGTFAFFFLTIQLPPGLFDVSSGLLFDEWGVTGEFEVPGWDGDFADPIAEPGSLALLGLGLLGLGFTRRRRAN